MSANETIKSHVGEEVVALGSASLGESGIPTRLMLAPWGTVESTSGDFVVDEESARLVIEAFAAHGTDVPIDYEHQTLGGSYAAPDGQAPAAAWIKAITAEPGVGLFAEIEWTEKARQRVLAREYRYVSPVALIRKADRKLVAIHSAALTNKPAIVGMEPIVNRTSATDGAQTADALMELRLDLNLTADVGVEQVLVAASRRLTVLAEEKRRCHAEERVAQAVRSGRLVEAQRQWAQELVLRDEASFDQWLHCAPVVVTRGRLPLPGRVDDGPGARRSAIAAKARAEFKAHKLVSALTSEEAYVNDALREAQMAVV